MTRATSWVERGSRSAGQRQSGHSQRWRQIAEELLVDLESAKERLLARSDELTAVERQTRDWDPTEPFLARRGLELRRGARQVLQDELTQLNVRLGHSARALRQATLARPVSDGPATSRQTLLEVRRHLRYLHHSFDNADPVLCRLLIDLDRLR